MSCLNLGKIFVVIFLVLETQAAQWFNEKYSHRPLHMEVDDLRHFGSNSVRINFESILDPILIPRVSGTEGNVVVRNYIKNYMANLGWAVESDAFRDSTPNGPVDFENVITTLNPDTPRRLVLACHYDSKYFATNNFVGATDSAVPCAMLLHLAATLRSTLDDHKSNPSNNVTLQFIFFDGEEAFREWSDVDSIYGSRHLAEVWEKTPYPSGNSEGTNMLHRIDMLVLLDLIGTKKASFANFFESTSHWHRDLVQVEQALRNTRMWTGENKGKAFFQSDPAYGGVEDDHIPFLRRNVDILHVISTPFPSVWHTARDNKSALDFQTIDNLNRVFRVFVARYLHLKGTLSISSGTFGQANILLLALTLTISFFSQHPWN